MSIKNTALAALLVIASFGASAKTVYLVGDIGSPEDHIVTYYELLTCKEGETMDMVISSPGGYLPGMFFIVDGMEKSKCKINVHVAGVAASAAAVIATYGDTIDMQPGSVLMFHTFSVQISGKSQEVLSSVQSADRAYRKVLRDAPLRLLSYDEIDRLSDGKDVYLHESDVDSRLAFQRFKDRIKEMFSK